MNQLYQEEIALYLENVSPLSPVGLCLKCLCLRSRQDVDSKERCAASIITTGLIDAPKAELHQWQAFQDSQSLLAYLKENMDQFAYIVKESNKLFAPLLESKEYESNTSSDKAAVLDETLSDESKDNLT
jgi:hypothetical protein